MNRCSLFVKKLEIYFRFEIELIERMLSKINKTPAKTFTPPAEKKKGHKVIFRQKSKRVTGLYNT